MNYIILDMEWNQGYPGQMVFIGDTRKRLSGEIIQFGAVKLNEAFSVVDTYTRLVRPVFYKKMHYKVQELTGISPSALSGASPFTDVFPDFIAWCGESYEFLIWGCDDIAILKQNVEINRIAGEAIHPWYNIQLIYNAQHGSEHEQTALSAACAELCIPQEKQLHNALNDAMYTAEVCRKLDMTAGLALCREKTKSSEETCRKKYRYYGFSDPGAAYRFACAHDNLCPLCGEMLAVIKPYREVMPTLYAAVRECGVHKLFVEMISISNPNPGAGQNADAESAPAKAKHRGEGFYAVKTVARVKDMDAAAAAINACHRRPRRRRKSPQGTPAQGNGKKP